MAQSNIETIIKLNVGGTHIDTTLGTLTKYKNTMLDKMFDGHFTPQNTEGRIFIDFSGEVFNLLLHKIRIDDVDRDSPPHQLNEEDWTKTLLYFGFLVEEGKPEKNKRKRAEPTGIINGIFPCDKSKLTIERSDIKQAENCLVKYHENIMKDVFRILFESIEFQNEVKKNSAKAILILPCGVKCLNDTNMYNYILMNQGSIIGFYENLMATRRMIIEQTILDFAAEGKSFNGTLYVGKNALKLSMFF